MSGYTIGPRLAAVLAEIAEGERLRAFRALGMEQTCYPTVAANEADDSRIIDGPASELIPPGRGRSTTRGMRP